MPPHKSTHERPLKHTLSAEALRALTRCDRATTSALLRAAADHHRKTNAVYPAQLRRRVSCGYCQNGGRLVTERRARSPPAATLRGGDRRARDETTLSSLALSSLPSVSPQRPGSPTPLPAGQGRGSPLPRHSLPGAVAPEYSGGGLPRPITPARLRSFLAPHLSAPGANSKPQSQPCRYLRGVRT